MTQIPAPSSIAQYIFSFTDTFIPNPIPIFTSLESFFYNRVYNTDRIRNTDSNLSEIIDTINRTSRYCFTTAQKIFSVINVASIFYSSYKIVQIAQATGLGAALPAIGIALATAGVSALAVNYLMTTPAEDNEIVNVEKSKTQKFSASTQLTQSLLFCILTIISSNKISYAISASLSIYCFLKNKQIDWFSTTFGGSCNRDGYSFTVKYNILGIPNQSADNTEDHISCSQFNTYSSFCNNNHKFCKTKECMEGTIWEEDPLLYVLANIIDFGPHILNHLDRNGRITNTTLKWKIKILKSGLIKCPICKEIPSYHKVQVFVDPTTLHLTDGRTMYTSTEEATVTIEEATVTIEDLEKSYSESHQTLFEKANTIYNIFQSAISALLLIPELAPYVYTIRSCMIVTDIAALIISGSYLAKNNKLGVIKTIFASIVTVAASYLCLTATDRLFANHFSLPTFSDNTLEASFTPPSFHQILKLINIARLFTTIGLYFSTKVHKGYAITSIATQMVGLYTLTNMIWLKIVQTLTLRYYVNGKPTNVVFSTYSVISSFTAKSQTFLSKAIDEISNFHSYLVNEGYWKIVSHTKYDIETARELVCDGTLPKIAKATEYITRPYLHTTDAVCKAFDYCTVWIN